MNFPNRMLVAAAPLAASFLLGGCFSDSSATNPAGGNDRPAFAASTINTNWSQKSGRASAIGAGATGAVFIVDRYDGAIEKWDGSSFQATNGSGFGCDVGADAEGHTSVWVIGQNSQVYESHDLQNWNGTGTRTFSDIGASTGGTVFALGTSYYPGTTDFPIFRWNSSTSDWDSLPGAGVRIDAGPDGTPWIVNSAHQIWHCDPNVTSCAQFTSQGATDIGVGASGQVWIVSNTPVASNGDMQILKWNGTAWDDTNGGARWITVDGSGNPWIANNDGWIYKGN